MRKIVNELDSKIEDILKSEIIIDGWNNEKLLQRESRAFDSEWVEECRRIKPLEVDDEIKIYIEAVRKAVFLAAFRKTNSSDIASLASDDFELFIAANHKKVASGFTAFLQYEYFNGRFPATFLRQ